MKQSFHSPFVLTQSPELSSVADLEYPQLQIDQNGLAVTLGAHCLRLSSSLTLPETGSWESELQSLAAVPAHQDAGSGLRRYRFVESPLHSALHIIDDAAQTQPDYCRVHTHDDAAELNVIIPSRQGLTYQIDEGHEQYEIYEPTALWFPADIAHCAIAKAGSGLFFVARIPKELTR